LNLILSLTPAVVLGAGVFFAGYLRGLPFLGRRGIRKTLGRGGGRSAVRSMLLALAGTLGVGNIIGVSSAIALGGAGAIFWMWVSALAAMFLKYAEVVLAMVFRVRTAEGRNRGGAPYYIRACVGERVSPGAGKVASVTFAGLCIGNALLMGCVIQSNAVAGAMARGFGVNPLLCGSVLAILCLLLLIRGQKGILAVTGVLVPCMSGFFLVLSLAILVARHDAILPALASVFKSAFSADSAAGGVLGFLMSRGIRYGTIRGIISNEAGCGTSPTAHAASETESPVEQGLFGILEVFVDTIVLCTVTALVVLIHGEVTGDPMEMTLAAYSAAFGGAPFVESALSLAILCFGFATMLCWAHYGIEALQFIFPASPVPQRVFPAIFCLFAAIGAAAAPALVWSLTDAITGIMTLLNVCVLLIARRRIQRETFDYYARR